MKTLNLLLSLLIAISLITSTADARGKRGSKHSKRSHAKSSHTKSSSSSSSSSRGSCPKCTALSSCSETESYLAKGCRNLDRDRDNIPCESLCN